MLPEASAPWLPGGAEYQAVLPETPDHAAVESTVSTRTAAATLRLAARASWLRQMVSSRATRNRSVSARHGTAVVPAARQTASQRLGDHVLAHEPIPGCLAGSRPRGRTSAWTNLIASPNSSGSAVIRFKRMCGTAPLCPARPVNPHERVACFALFRRLGHCPGMCHLSS
jgi:hypothetical protein